MLRLKVTQLEEDPFPQLLRLLLLSQPQRLLLLLGFVMAFTILATVVVVQVKAVDLLVVAFVFLVIAVT